MAKVIEIIQLISLSLGATADLLFLILFFIIPLVKHGPGLKFIAIAVMFNFFLVIAHIVFLMINSKGIIIHFLRLIICNYCYFSSMNWTLFYNYCIYLIICKKEQINSELILRFVKLEILFSLILVLGLIIGNIIYFKCSTELANYIFVSINSFIYLVLEIFSLKLSYLIYLELKNMYLMLKRRAIIDFARLISFPFIMMICNCCVAVYNFYFPSDKNKVSVFYIFSYSIGVFMLFCLFITQEMKDGMKLLKFKTRLINYEL